MFTPLMIYVLPQYFVQEVGGWVFAFLQRHVLFLLSGVLWYD